MEDILSYISNLDSSSVTNQHLFNIFTFMKKKQSNITWNEVKLIFCQVFQIDSDFICVQTFLNFFTAIDKQRTKLMKHRKTEAERFMNKKWSFPQIRKRAT